MKQQIPKYVSTVLSKLRAAGYEAYPVGGCVRDMCLGKRPHDWDVCSSALPEEAMQVFPHSHPTGIKHGTVTIVIGHSTVELTTFRTESDYSDHRHPDTVSFVRELNKDLARRDFTINAMALAEDGSVIDPFGGMDDLRAGIIRCVGSAEKRFDEDALRMLRAFRFSSRFGFEIESETRRAMEKCAPLAAFLAAERVREEIEKILLSPAPETLSELMSVGLLESCLPGVRTERVTLSALRTLPKKPEYRWCAFCVLTGSDADILLSALKLDSKTVSLCRSCEDMLSAPAPKTTSGFKHFISRYGEAAVTLYAYIYDMLHDGGAVKMLERILASGECCTLKDLRISGRELAALGISGPAVGQCLNTLLEYIFDHPDDNRPDKLLSLAGTWRGRYGQL